jgi:hypothetical protein
MDNPRIRFALGSHVWFGNLDFICTGVDYDLVPLPPNINFDAISEALSNLWLGMDEGQAPENDRPGGSQSQTTPTGKPHDHGRACGLSSTTIRFDPSMGKIPVDLPSHQAQAIIEILATTETTSSTSSDEDDSSWAGTDNGYKLTWP